jgi:hypothetical protein
MKKNVTEQPAKPPMSIDVGLKAQLQVEAKIPKKSVGRLVDSLTDIIRPFTESQGLKADQVRLQREDVCIEIARKARMRAEIEHIELKPVPTKMLIPFLEKASLEDLDNEMRERWVELLLSASQGYYPRHLTYIDILSRLSSNEVILIEKVCLSYDRFPETNYPYGHIEHNRQKLSKYDAKIFNGYGQRSVCIVSKSCKRAAFDIWRCNACRR